MEATQDKLEIHKDQMVFKIRNKNLGTGFFGWSAKTGSYYGPIYFDEMMSKFGGVGKTYLTFATAFKDFMRIFDIYVTAHPTVSLDEFKDTFEIIQFNQLAVDLDKDNANELNAALDKVTKKAVIFKKIFKDHSLSSGEQESVMNAWQDYSDKYPIVVVFKYGKTPADLNTTVKKSGAYRKKYQCYFFADESDKNLVMLVHGEEVRASFNFRDYE